MHQDGGSVTVVDGQVEIHVGTEAHLVNARERADFDSMRATGYRVITEADVAPWHLNQ